MSQPLVSIALVTRNGAATLPALLDAVWRQRATFPVQVVAVDSGSTDGSVEMLRQRAARVVEVSPAEFNHGRTRNLAVETTEGSFVVMLVQDAIPVGADWLAALVKPLLEDARVAGTFARQLPAADASELAKHYLSLGTVASGEGYTASVTPEEFESLGPMERMRSCTFDNVCSCIRRDVWREHPFQAVTIAEDLAWGREVLLAGHRLVYVPEAVVTHSHDRSARYEFTRTRQLHEQLGALFGVRTIPSVGALARAIASCTVGHLWRERNHPARLPRALALAVAWPLGQYLGGRGVPDRPAGLGISG